MKRVATLVASVAYLVATPVLLVSVSLDPRSLIRRADGTTDLFVVDEVVTIVLAVGVWVAWAGSLGSLLVQLRRLREGRSLAEPRFRVMATLAVALWSMAASGRHAPAVPVDDVPASFVEHDQGLTKASVTALVTPALAAAVLAEVGRRRNRAMRRAGQGQRLAPYSRVSRALLDRLEPLAVESDHEAGTLDSIVEPPDLPLEDVDPADARAIGDLLDESDRLVHVEAEGRREETDPDWSVMVRVLGPVELTTREGRAVEVRKSRSLELLAWLVTHRERPTRSAARTAMWESDVQDATFHNVVSEARRALAASGVAGDALGRPSSPRFEVHPWIVSDAELLEAAYRRARGDSTALWELGDALDLVSDLPFAGAGYRWPDTEGITSNLVLLVVDSCTLLAEQALLAGDTAGVFRATGRGLRVLAGHEGLVSLRMRAHASTADFAAVEDEWRRYERAARLDDDIIGASKVRRLREELLGGRV